MFSLVRGTEAEVRRVLLLNLDLPLSVVLRELTGP